MRSDASPTVPAAGSAASAALVVALASAATVGGALFFQHGLGYVPCMLCLWGRWPHYVGVPLAFLALTLAWRGQSGGARLFLTIAAIGYLAGVALSAFHAGVEWGFWPGPTSCAGADAAPTSAGGLLESLKTTRIVPCDRAAWRLFGVSLAGYNALISLALAAICFIGVKRR